MELLRVIRKKHQREIGLAQDLIVESIYQFFPKAVLHGGTLIWRCFKGNRLSEDLDFYLEKRKEKKLKEFFESLKTKGFKIKKLRIKEKSVYSKLSYGRIEIRVEIVFKKVKGVLMDYECLDGRIIPIKGLDAKDLILEKISAFITRKKIRDLYDIYYLLKFVKPSKNIKKALSELIEKFEKPKDEKELEKVILYGYVPKSKEIIKYLKRWVK